MTTDNVNAFTITSKGKGINVRTAKGRLSYPQVFSPREDNSGTPKFSASLLFPKGTDLSGLHEAIDLAAKEQFGLDYAKKHPKLKTPILKTAESPAIGANPEEFPVFIRTSTKADSGKPVPQVVDREKAPVTDLHEVYAGRWARLTITVKGYDRDGNKGVTCYLGNVQILEHDDKLGGGGGSASSEFEAVPVSGDASDMFK